MKKSLLFIVFPLLLMITGLFILKRSSEPQQQHEILVTIAPYKKIVEELVDHQIKVKTLIPESADPHGYEPNAKELVSLFQTKLWFTIGEPFEEQLLPILKKNNLQIKAIDLKENISLLKSCCSHHGDDLHFWMSPKIVKAQLNHIADSLKNQWPEKAELIDKNLERLNLEFIDLDLFLITTLNEKKDSYLLTSHPAFGYFCHDYGLKQLSIETEGGDPSAKEFTDLLSLVKENHIQNIYTQKQHNTKASEILAKEMNLSCIEVNPYAEDYFDNLRHFGKVLGE